MTSTAIVLTLVSEEETQLAHQELGRLLSYEAALGDLPVSRVAASTAGFMHSQSAGTTHFKCPFCELELSALDSSQSLLTWHRVQSPHCPFLQDNTLVNVTFLDNSNLTRHAEVLPILHTITDDNTVRVTLTSTGVTPNVGAAEEPQSSDTSAYEAYKKLNTLRSQLPDTHISHISKSSAAVNHSGITYELNRRKTFVGWPKEEIVSVNPLAASGFIFTGNRDTVECVFCKVQISDWAESFLPVDQKHMKSSQQCLFMQGSKSITNIPDVISPILAITTAANPEISAQLGIVTETAKTPEFAVEARRKATFLTWPTANHKLASEMIEHHLYYKGHGDEVCCFSCGIEMSGWSSIDNIWIRHARQAPHCQLVIQEKGADWVAATLEEHGPYQVEEREPAIITVTTRMLRPRMDNLATQNVLKMTNPSYPREEVRSALIQNIKYGRQDWMNRTDIVKAMLKRRGEKRRSEAEQRVRDTEPLPPQVVCPPRRSREGEAILLPSSVHPSAAAGEESFTSSPSAAAGFGDAARMEVEPTASTSQQSAQSVLAANPIDLARIMKAQLTCKICMDAPVGIAFLPCGHMVCCPSCAPAMVQCPLCRQDVRGTVRVYLDKL